MPYKLNAITGELDLVDDVSGFVYGPGSATANAIPTFDGMTGALLQSTNVIIDGSDNISAAESITLNLGTSIYEFSTDGTLSGDSDLAVPTEKAVKTYVDASGGGDVSGPGSATANAIPTFDGITGALLQSTNVIIDGSDNISAAESITLNLGTSIYEFSTDGTLSGDSDLAVPTEKAVKTYVDASGGGDVYKVGTPAANQVAVWTGDGTIEGTTNVNLNSLTLATDLAVAEGGTGRSSHTAYAVICGGTTATAAQQSIASVGTSGHVFTSNGAGALPTFQAAAGGGGAYTLVSVTTLSGAATLDLTGLTATAYRIVFANVKPSSDASFDLTVTNDGGSTWVIDNYQDRLMYGEGPGAITVAGSDDTINIPLTTTVGASTTESGINGFMDITSMNNASWPASFVWSVTYMSGSNTNYLGNGAGVTCNNLGESSLDIDGIRITPAAGNMASGSVYLYSLAIS